MKKYYVLIRTETFYVRTSSVQKYDGTEGCNYVPSRIGFFVVRIDT